MTLADALRGMPERGLGPYRGAAGAPGAGIADLVARLTDPPRVIAAVHDLQPGPLLALRILWFHTAPRMQPWLFHTVFTHSGGGGGADRAIETLVEQALLIPPLSSAGQYVIPEEIRPALLELVTREWLPASGFYLPAEALPPQSWGVDPATVVADFVRFLGALRAGVRVRQQDPLPYQTDQRRMADALDRSSQPALPPTSPGRTPWEGYDPAIGPLFAAAVSFGLMESRDGAWRDSPRVAEWVHLPPEVQWRGLLQLWAALCGRHLDDPLVRGVYGCIGAGTWCRPVALARWLSRFTAEGRDGLQAEVQNIVVGLGVRIGALEWGIPAEAGSGQPSPGEAAAAVEPNGTGRTPPDPPVDCAVRLRPEAAHALGGAAAADFPPFDEAPLVQGTFEILAGPRTPPSVVWLLESWAERVAVDRFTTYRLTRRSVGGAVRRAERVEELLGALERSPAGIPQNVAFSVREWAAGVVRLTADLALLLRCPDIEGAERAARTGALRGCERLGPTTWQVPADNAAAVWRALADAGCDVVGDLQEIRDRISGRLHRPSRSGTPRHPHMPWPGTPDLPLPAGEYASARPRRDAERGAGPVRDAAGSRVHPARAADTRRQEPPRGGRRVPVRSLGDALPAVMRLARHEVVRALQRAIRSGRPLGLVDSAGVTHVLAVRELTDEAVTGDCSRCGTEHHLPMDTITATVRV